MSFQKLISKIMKKEIQIIDYQPLYKEDFKASM
jgi:hypothetical protein